jgi:hypothetical protein
MRRASKKSTSVTGLLQLSSRELLATENPESAAESRYQATASEHLTVDTSIRHARNSVL